MPIAPTIIAVAELECDNDTTPLTAAMVRRVERYLANLRQALEEDEAVVAFIGYTGAGREAVSAKREKITVDRIREILLGVTANAGARKVSPGYAFGEVSSEGTYAWLSWCVEEIDRLKLAMPINATVQEVHALSTAKGWWSESPDTSSRHMMMVTEFAEASDSVRKGEPSVWLGKDGKPEGEAVELADCVIRIMDYFGQRGWNLEEMLRLKMEFNKTRPGRVDGKVTP